MFHYGRSILQAYVPSIIRGRNIVKAISETDAEMIFDMEETDSEVLFKFNCKDSDVIIPLLKPKTGGANTSPFSSRNLPKNKDYKVPDEDLQAYKDIVSKIPRERTLSIGHSTINYIKSISNKKCKSNDIKADMLKVGLRGKEYIHYIGKWEDYIEYLKNNL